MGKRNLIPRLQLGALAVLTGVFALVGALMVPTSTPTDVVQNATEATFGSQSFVLQLTIGVSAGQNAGMLLQVRRIDYTSPARMTVYQTSTPAKVLGAIAPSMIRSVLDKYIAVTGGTTVWTERDGHYTRTEPLDVFAHRVSPIGVRSAQGEVSERAVIRGGYLLSVDLYIVVPNQTLPGGQQAPGGIAEEDYKLVQIDGTATSAIR